uniref:Transposase n=1 Tax=Plectus sambesii TaxID=2011161 RepID=A0A914XLV2_9BILA
MYPSILHMPITAPQRIAIALRYLPSGDDFNSLLVHYKIGYSTVRTIVRQVCSAVQEHLGPVALPKPIKDTWLNAAKGFWEKWQFPYCFATIDRKHVMMQVISTFSAIGEQ